MAEKEATVYVVDVGQSMGQKNSNRSQTDLEWSLQYVWDKITNTVFTGRKTAQLGVVALGTDSTDNSMGDDESYEHISIIQPISQILMPQLQSTSSKLKPSHTDKRDALSAIIIAVHMIMQHCRHLQFKKKIILVTNGSGRMDPDPEDLKSTAEQIRNNNIELTILGVDFDDEEYGYQEQKKEEGKAKNEQLLKSLASDCDGLFGTMQEAVDNLSRPRINNTRPIPTYKGFLSLGDPEHFDTALTIEIERYFRTAIKRPPAASAFVLRNEAQSTQGETLASVHNKSTYLIKDEMHPEGQRNVDREQLAKGYEYGRTAVHISESDENITKLETNMSYDILGFIPVDNVERYMLMDVSNLIVAQKGNDKAAFALSSLIHALYELGSVAVGRLIKKDMAEPLLTLLSPLVEEEIECLVENALPFAEDLRTYRFPPLDKVMTVSGKSLTTHRNLPNDVLVDCMSNFVDSMILSDENGELMLLEDTFSPNLHTVEAAIKYRAVKPEAELPAKPPLLMSYSQPPKGLQERAGKALEQLVEAADVKRVPPKVKGRRRYRDVEKPISGLDVEELFRKEKRTTISPDNAIPEFKQQLAAPDNIEVVQRAVDQMRIIIENQIRKSFGDQNYDRVLEGLEVIRGEIIDFEEPEIYNDMMRQIKSKLLADELGGNRKELWWRIKNGRLGLIDKQQSPASSVSREEADEFWK